MVVFVGDDWSEDHHDVAVCGDDGELITVKRLSEGAGGLGAFHELVGSHVEDPAEVLVGIETDRGLWAQALIAAGYRVYVLNPLGVSNYRKQHSLAGAKSDRSCSSMPR